MHEKRGLDTGGRAPNVISDFAKPNFLSADWSDGRAAAEIQEAVGELAEVNFTRETPFLRLRTLDGLPTMVAASPPIFLR